MYMYTEIKVIERINFRCHRNKVHLFTATKLMTILGIKWKTFALAQLNYSKVSEWKETVRISDVVVIGA